MRANVILFWILAGFFALVGRGVHRLVAALDDGDPGVEWVGIVALSLTRRPRRLHRVLPRTRAQCAGRGAARRPPRREHRRRRRRTRLLQPVELVADHARRIALRWRSSDSRSASGSRSSPSRSSSSPSSAGSTSTTAATSPADRVPTSRSARRGSAASGASSAARTSGVDVAPEGEHVDRHGDVAGRSRARPIRESSGAPAAWWADGPMPTSSARWAASTDASYSSRVCERR